ncbi:9750_t:CDS:1 [Paraglomus brasilianum]|uniref:9750_t:CDS:1 n=1 Tax=Paraglomus brasilianum TaxID=144538 RepID=A0A9N9FD43_9GLOM|nr:9750_t:CDS:1 [Paraglomus brasilianum]
MDSSLHDIPSPYFLTSTHSPSFETKDLQDSCYIDPQDPFAVSFFYGQDYTPSYGSPQSSIYESSSSISDYEPLSDEYSSCGSSVLSSPNIPQEFLEEEQRRNSFEFSEEFETQDFVHSHLDFANFAPFPQMSPDQIMTRENNPFGSLKLNTNIASLSNDENNTILTPNTHAALEAIVAEHSRLNAPTLNLFPATPITPTKAQAIADSLYPNVPPMARMVTEETRHDMDTSNNNGTSTTAGTNTATSTTATSQTTATTKPSRSHRKQLPVDMVQRLHTMNLAPPKPSRKSRSSAPFHCPHGDCPKTFTRQYNLKSHLRTHTNERPFVCGYQGCTRAFARQHDRKRHYNLHLGFKPHVCSHCGRAFARLDALNRHLRSDSGAPCAQAVLPNGGAKKFKPVNM